MSELASEELDFDPSKLSRGPKHSGRTRRVIAECRRCSARYEIGEGGNVQCPTCWQIDAARVILRELTPDRWQRAHPECAVSGCLNVPTHEVVVVETIPGTPQMPTLLCDEHKDAFVTRSWDEEESSSNGEG